MNGSSSIVAACISCSTNHTKTKETNKNNCFCGSRKMFKKLPFLYRGKGCLFSRREMDAEFSYKDRIVFDVMETCSSSSMVAQTYLQMSFLVFVHTTHKRRGGTFPATARFQDSDFF